MEAGYAASIDACLGAERAALAVAESREAWAVVRDRLRSVCDPAIETWEAAREAHKAAHRAVDACELDASAECFARAYEVVQRAKVAAEQATDAWSAARDAIERPEPAPGPAELDGGEAGTPAEVRP